MIRQYHGLSGHEFEQTLGDTVGQGCLACCGHWVCRVRHNLTNEQQEEHTLLGENPDIEFASLFYRAKLKS